MDNQTKADDIINPVRYVCGFLFNIDDKSKRVMLIRKNRPAFQAGYLNGIGGHIEPGETSLQAMQREFLEEANLYIEDWQHDTTLRGKYFNVEFFHAVTDAETFDSARSMTDEKIEVVNLEMLHDVKLLNNVHLLISAALDRSGLKKPIILNDSSFEESQEPSA